MKENPYKKLLSNTLAFTIANFGSKIISFIVVPVYSYLLTKEEYGTIDLIVTISSLLLPVLFLCISDAVLRYVMDKNHDASSIVSNCLIIIAGGAAIFLCILPIFARLYPKLTRYLSFIAFVLITNELSTLFNTLLRAVGKVKLFAVNGVLHTLTFVGCNVLFLIVFNLKVEGYLLSYIISSGVSFAFAFIAGRAWTYIRFRFDKIILGKMIKYSVPLIPNALMWWVMDASDKFVITFFLGIAANGVYAMAKKIPSIIDMLNGFFNQAWRLSAIEENDSSDVKRFTSKIYELYYLLHTLIIGGLLVLSRPFVMVLSESYQTTWEYIPLLLVSVSASSLSAFLGSKFIAKEKTNIIFKTTVIGAVVNTVLNFLLIPSFGLNGAGAATLVGFAVVLVIRERRLKKDDDLEITFARWPLYGAIALEFILYYLMPVWWSSVANLLVLCVLIFIKRETFMDLFRRLIETARARQSKKQ